jgi:hypothetical protein
MVVQEPVGRFDRRRVVEFITTGRAGGTAVETGDAAGRVGHVQA